MWRKYIIHTFKGIYRFQAGSSCKHYITDTAMDYGVTIVVRKRSQKCFPNPQIENVKFRWFAVLNIAMFMI